MLPVVTVDDDANWADALAQLRRVPAPTAPERARSAQRFVVVRAVTVSLAGAGLLLLGGVLAFGSGVVSDGDRVAPWQLIAGLVLAALGPVVQVWGQRVYRQTLGRRGPRPLNWLDRSQRRELRAQLRGLRPVEPALLPLTRHLAEQRAAQDRLQVANVGLLVLWVGLTVGDPERLRVALVGVYVLVLAVSWPLTLRSARHARRFLAEHPLGDDG